MATDYPWNGRVELKILENKAGRFSLAFRVPGWARGIPVPGDLYSFSQQEAKMPVIYLNGKEEPAEFRNGYLVVARKWKENDRVEITFDMPVRTLHANPAVKADRGRFALQRGPLVYCLEWPDQPSERVFNLAGKPDGPFQAYFDSTLLKGVETIVLPGLQRNDSGTKETWSNVSLKAIPYYFWANRGPGEMEVWIPAENGLALKDREEGE